VGGRRKSEGKWGERKREERESESGGGSEGEGGRRGQRFSSRHFSLFSRKTLPAVRLSTLSLFPALFHLVSLSSRLEEKQGQSSRRSLASACPADFRRTGKEPIGDPCDRSPEFDKRVLTSFCPLPLVALRQRIAFLERFTGTMGRSHGSVGRTRATKKRGPASMVANGEKRRKRKTAASFFPPLSPLVLPLKVNHTRVPPSTIRWPSIPLFRYVPSTVSVAHCSEVERGGTA
jgi:hypothetical protein